MKAIVQDGYGDVDVLKFADIAKPTVKDDEVLIHVHSAGLDPSVWHLHLYRGLYEWDDPELAVSYVRALWWVLRLVSEPGSIHYSVLPGLDRDNVLANPAVIDEKLSAAPGGWWRPIGQSAITR